MCLLELNPSHFSKDISKKYGLCGRCKKCNKTYKESYRKRNKAKIAERKKEYYTKNREKVKLKAAEYRETLDKDAVSTYNKKYRKENIEKHKEHKSRWQKNNRHKTRSSTARRRAARIQATPGWLTEEQLNDIKFIYQQAEELQWLSEEPFEVDHIVPLRGKEVCGLHVPWNLQILPRDMNRKKSNLFKGD